MGRDGLRPSGHDASGGFSAADPESDQAEPPSFEISAVSSIVAGRTPLTRTWSARVNAHALVDEVLETTAVWDGLPEWEIPGERISADAASRVDLAGSVVAAAGGLLTVDPDGTVVCRPKHRVPLSLYPAVEPDVHLSDIDVDRVGETFAAAAVLNAVLITDGEGTSGPGIEWTADDTDSLKGVLRVPVTESPPRAVSLDHTADTADASIGARGVVSRRETETIDIRGGFGDARHPVWGIDSVVCSHRSPGSIRPLEPGSTRLIAAVSGAGRLTITYATIAWESRLEARRTDTALFLATEEDGRRPQRRKNEFCSRRHRVVPGFRRECRRRGDQRLLRRHDDPRHRRRHADGNGDVLRDEQRFAQRSGDGNRVDDVDGAGPADSPLEPIG